MGKPLRLKAYECIIMLQFVIHLLSMYDGSPYQRHLTNAAESVWDFYSSLKGEPMKHDWGYTVLFSYGIGSFRFELVLQQR